MQFVRGREKAEIGNKKDKCRSPTEERKYSGPVQCPIHPERAKEGQSSVKIQLRRKVKSVHCLKHMSNEGLQKLWVLCNKVWEESRVQPGGRRQLLSLSESHGKEASNP